jgi:hypothetical protein
LAVVRPRVVRDAAWAVADHGALADQGAPADGARATRGVPAAGAADGHGAPTVDAAEAARAGADDGPGAREAARVDRGAYTTTRVAGPPRAGATSWTICRRAEGIDGRDLGRRGYEPACELGTGDATFFERLERAAQARSTRPTRGGAFPRPSHLRSPSSKALRVVGPIGKKAPLLGGMPLPDTDGESWDGPAFETGQGGAGDGRRWDSESVISTRSFPAPSEHSPSRDSLTRRVPRRNPAPALRGAWGDARRLIQ